MRLKHSFCLGIWYSFKHYDARMCYVCILWTVENVALIYNDINNNTVIIIFKPQKLRNIIEWLCWSSFEIWIQSSDACQMKKFLSLVKIMWLSRSTLSSTYKWWNCNWKKEKPMKAVDFRRLKDYFSQGGLWWSI